MAKLYLKIFPKLVSSLAVLLLCQFGYVVCKAKHFSDSSRLPADEGTQDILFHLLIYPFPTIYKRRKKICLSVKYELFLQYLLPILADPLLFQMNQLIISYEQKGLFLCGFHACRALQAKVMAKLYLKLFPKLVSSLAVLLLCQFGYVVCKATNLYIWHACLDCLKMKVHTISCLLLTVQFALVQFTSIMRFLITT